MLKVIGSALLILFMAVPGHSQLMMLGLGNAGGAAAVPNINFVRKFACQGTGAQKGTCLSITQTAGNFGLVIENDFGASVAGMAPVSTCGDTWVTDASATFASAGPAVPHTIFYWVPSLAGGSCDLTITPNTGAWSVGYYEFTGMAASPFDKCMSGNLVPFTSTNATTIIGSNPVGLASQGDLAVGVVLNRSSAAGGYVAADVWNAPNALAMPQNGDGDGAFASYILNGFGSFTFEATATSVLNNNGVICLWKAANAGSAPAGNLPVLHADFETGSMDGTALTAALMNNNNSTHGGVANWVAPAGFTLKTAAQINSLSNITTNGTTRTGHGSLGVSWDRTQNPVQQVALTIPASTHVEMGAWVVSPSTQVSGKFDSVIEISASTNDYITVQFLDNLTMTVECNSGDVGSFPFTLSTPYHIDIQFNGTMGGNHFAWISDSTGTLITSRVSCPTTGAFNASAINFGNSHGGGAGATGVTLFDNIEADWINVVVGTQGIKP